MRQASARSSSTKRQVRRAAAGGETEDRPAFCPPMTFRPPRSLPQTLEALQQALAKHLPTRPSNQDLKALEAWVDKRAQLEDWIKILTPPVSVIVHHPPEPRQAPKGAPLAAAEVEDLSTPVFVPRLRSMADSRSREERFEALLTKLTEATAKLGTTSSQEEFLRARTKVYMLRHQVSDMVEGSHGHFTLPAFVKLPGDPFRPRGQGQPAPEPEVATNEPAILHFTPSSGAA